LQLFDGGYRYTKDLPVGVTRMNEECLKLKDHTAGYQTVQDIQRVVTEAIGGRAALSNEQLIDEVMVCPATLHTTYNIIHKHSHADRAAAHAESRPTAHDGAKKAAQPSATSSS